MAKQRHKRKKSYTVLLVPNLASMEQKQYRLSRVMTTIVLIVILCMCIAGSGVFLTVNSIDQVQLPSMKLNFQSKQVNSDKVKELEDQISQLELDKNNLEEQVSILSSAVSQRDAKLEQFTAENEARNKPTGFPLNGNATISFDGTLSAYLSGGEEQTQEEQDPGEDQNAEEQDAEEEVQGDAQQEQLTEEGEQYIVVFEASEGVAVVATGYGVVTSIVQDPDFGYCVKIDHANGYESIYLSKSEPKIREGSEVARGTVIFELEDVSKVGYEINFEQKSVDPLSVMEIAG